MPSSYDEAVVALYQSPHDAFVAERKRLAAELKQSGDSAGAARLTRRGRPSISVWAVNQLYWHARTAFDELMETAERLRQGDLGATSAHREALGKLRARAAKLLGDAGHAASEATLRRVTTTLAALAAAGGFIPDLPGALAQDRDPPGFEPLGTSPGAPERATTPKREGSSRSQSEGAADDAAEKRRHKAEAARERAEAAAAAAKKRRRIEEERAKRKVEHQRLSAELRAAKEDLRERTRELERLQREAAAAEQTLERARAGVTELEERLTLLDRTEDEA